MGLCKVHVYKLVCGKILHTYSSLQQRELVCRFCQNPSQSAGKRKSLIPISEQLHCVQWYHIKTLSHTRMYREVTNLLQCLDSNCIHESNRSTINDHSLDRRSSTRKKSNITICRHVYIHVHLNLHLVKSIKVPAINMYWAVILKLCPTCLRFIDNAKTCSNSCGAMYMSRLSHPCLRIAL